MTHYDVVVVLHWQLQCVVPEVFWCRAAAALGCRQGLAQACSCMHVPAANQQVVVQIAS